MPLPPQPTALFAPQIPDVDAVLQVSDHPCMAKNPRNPWPQFNASHLAALNVSTDPMPAVFNWDMDPEFVDVPFPDFSYWGHEVDRFRGPGGEQRLVSAYLVSNATHEKQR